MSLEETKRATARVYTLSFSTGIEVMRALDEVPREYFVPPDYAAIAYADHALPIACGQTISQPFIVGLMTQALQLDPANAALHFFNGFVYHLQARAGDAEKAALAIEGYRQALRIDPAHWIAHEFLGLALIEQKNYPAAQQALAEYQAVPAAEEALAILVYSYDALGMAQLRDDARRVLERNYPNSSYLKNPLASRQSKPWWQLFW